MIFVSTDFTGIWPVGTALVVQAPSHDEAVKIAGELCKELPEGFDGNLKQLAEDFTGMILCNGDY